MAGGTGGGATPAPGASAECKAATPTPGESPLRLLDQNEYLNTVHDLFGPVNLDAVYPRVADASIFGLAQGDIDQVAVEGYQRAATLIAAAVVGNKAMLDQIAPCPAGMDRKGCARTFLQTWGPRIYRSPLEVADIDRHLPIYDVGAGTATTTTPTAGAGYPHGIELLLQAMLQSPRFLYHVELGTGEMVGASAVKLSGYEVAARLSYGLWRTAPDELLRAAAAQGDLSTRDGVTAAVNRMLKDSRRQTTITQFLEAWIHLPELETVVKDASLFPEWNDALRAAMVTQAHSFFDDLVNHGPGNLSTLLTSSTVFVDRNLAGFYGADPAGIAQNTFQKTQRPGFEAGFLVLPAFLATQAKASEGSPIYRGKFVREQLLCQELPAPPADVPPPPEVMPGVSTRERFAQHVSIPSCAACHSLMDPIGLGFESYDGIGRYRSMDSGKAVDASGEVTGTRDIDGPFTGVPALAAKLSRSSELQECLAKQWFRYTLGRIEQPADSCSLQAMTRTFRDSGGVLSSLPAAVVQTDAFLYRRPMTVEVKP